MKNTIVSNHLGKKCPDEMHEKIPLAMRCTLFMLFCLVGMTFANEGYAQKTMVNIALENKTVDEVLTELEQGTEFVFFYNNKQIDVKRRVSVRK